MKQGGGAEMIHYELKNLTVHYNQAICLHTISFLRWSGNGQCCCSTDSVLQSG